MVRQFSLMLVVAFASLSSEARNAQAFDAFFGNPFLGSYNYSYAYRLPTPPYFAIFPPVYYGRRYERPYGDSPFASNSHLGGNPSYNIRPKQSPVQWTVNGQSVVNAYESMGAGAAKSVPSNVSATGKQVTIINHFVRNDEAIAGN